jgi:hypothetical protein
MALTNAIHWDKPSASDIAFFATLRNIKDCIAAGDLWFEEDTGNAWRVSTDSGFAAIVSNRLAWI